MFKLQTLLEGKLLADYPVHSHTNNIRNTTNKYKSERDEIKVKYIAMK